MPSLLATIRRRCWSWLALGVCLVLFALRSEQIQESLPYPRHVDERHLAQHAADMLETGDLNPHFFNYPSLPIYATAMGMSWGALRDFIRQDSPRKFETGRVREPYYTRPGVMAAARQTALAMGLFGLFSTGVAAAAWSKRSVSRFLAPAILALSPLYGFHCWDYLNVDLFAATFSVATLAWLARSFHSRGFIAKALVPGLLAAATTASKYNAGLVLPACMLSIFWFEAREQRWVREGQLLVVFILGFVAFCPFSVLDTPNFVRDVAHEVHHYSTGHANPTFTIAPGSAHLTRNLGLLIHEFDWLLCALGALGLASGMRRDWRRTSVLAFTPLATLAFMSAQRVHFVRNLLPVVAILPLFISLGLLEATDRLRRAASRYLSPRLASGFAVAIFAAAVAFSFRGAWKQYAIRSDSRNLALEWLSRNAPADARIVVDQSLAMDLSASSSRWRVRTGKMSQAFNAHDAKAGRRFVVVGTNAPLPAPLRELQPQFRAGSGKVSRPLVNPRLAVYELR